MKTLREKITFVLTALAYLLFHLRMGADLGQIATGTLSQMLLTAPYAIGFAYIVATVVRRLSGRGHRAVDGGGQSGGRLGAAAVKRAEGVSDGQ